MTVSAFIDAAYGVHQARQRKVSHRVCDLSRSGRSLLREVQQAEDRDKELHRGLAIALSDTATQAELRGGPGV
jgi:hypothetical protein